MRAEHSTRRAHSCTAPIRPCFPSLGECTIPLLSFPISARCQTLPHPPCVIFVAGCLPKLRVSGLTTTVIQRILINDAMTAPTETRDDLWSYCYVVRYGKPTRTFHGDAGAIGHGVVGCVDGLVVGSTCPAIFHCAKSQIHLREPRCKYTAALVADDAANHESAAMMLIPGRPLET